MHALAVVRFRHRPPIRPPQTVPITNLQYTALLCLAHSVITRYFTKTLPFSIKINNTFLIQTTGTFHSHLIELQALAASVLSSDLSTGWNAFEGCALPRNEGSQWDLSGASQKFGYMTVPGPSVPGPPL